MKKNKNFREKFLLSQEEIALFLGVKRSLWAMYEIGQRSLPTAALMRLSTLTIYADALSESAKKELPHQKKQEVMKQKLLVKQIEDDTFEKLQLQKKLEQMESHYERATNTLHFINHIKEKEIVTEREDAIFQVLKNKALASLEKNGVHFQTLHRLKLNTLKAHIKALKKELRKE